MTYEKIKERYMKRYIRDDQLARFVELKVITQAEADSIVQHFSELKRGGGRKSLLTLYVGGKLVLIYA